MAEYGKGAAKQGKVLQRSGEAVGSRGSAKHGGEARGKGNAWLWMATARRGHDGNGAAMVKRGAT